MTEGAGRGLGIVAVLAAAVLWGSTGTVQGLLPESREPMAVAAIRLVVGAACLVLLAGVTVRPALPLRDLPWGWISAAGVAIAGYNLLFFVAVSSAGVGLGTALAISSAPVWVLLWDSVALRRRPGGRRVTGTLMSLIGAALLVLAGSGTAAASWGMVLAVLAGGCYGAYSVLTARIPRRVPATLTAASTFCVAAVVLSPVLLWVPVRWAVAPGAWPLLLFLGAVATGLSYVFYTEGLRRVRASTAVTLALAEPLTAWILGRLLLDEPSGPIQTAGALVLLAGLALVVSAPRDKAAPAVG